VTGDRPPFRGLVSLCVLLVGPQYPGQLLRACVELAKAWRSDNHAPPLSIGCSGARRKRNILEQMYPHTVLQITHFVIKIFYI